MSFAVHAQRLLASRRFPWLSAAAAVALCAPSLGLGLIIDDYFLQLALTRPPLLPEWSRSWVNAFAFFDGNRESLRTFIDSGVVPWWTSEHLRIAFFRPLTGLTHWIDFRVWPSHPWVMHAQSLLWLGGAVAAAAFAYRRLIEPAWIAGLAALLFAVDDAHSLPAAWLANRNATVATLFALLAILAHDRWRRESSGPAGTAAPALLLLALLGGESAVGALGYLAAYALFVDTGSLRRRLISLVPSGAVTMAWALTYRALGFGASGSAMYVDPGASPVAFARAVWERAPLLLFGQWALPSGLHLLLSQQAAAVMWLAACATVVVVGGLLAPLVARDRTARFFAAGMVLSLLPACGTFPDDRLLFLSGFGAMGLLALWLSGVWARSEWLPRSTAWQLPACGAAVVFVALHLLLAPLLLAGASSSLHRFGEVFARAARSFPADGAVRRQTVVIVTTPSAFVSAHGPLQQALRGNPVPARTLVLSSGIRPVRIARPGASVLVVRPEGGFLAPPGAPWESAAQPTLDPRYALQVFDRLYRDSPMQSGQRLTLTAATVEVTAVTRDGRPAEATFRFAAPLEEGAWRWIQWRDGVYVPFAVPAEGETVTLGAPAVPF